MNRIDSCIVWRRAKYSGFSRQSPEFWPRVPNTEYVLCDAPFITPKLQPRPRFSASTLPRPPRPLLSLTVSASFGLSTLEPMHQYRAPRCTVRVLAVGGGPLRRHVNGATKGTSASHPASRQIKRQLLSTVRSIFPCSHVSFNVASCSTLRLSHEIWFPHSRLTSTRPVPREAQSPVPANTFSFTLPKPHWKLQSTLPSLSSFHL